ncbi:ITIH4, partial [Symbiodinium pilosum]
VSRVLEVASRHSDQGRFQEARELLRDKQRKICSAPQTPVFKALNVQLADAEDRMSDQGSWRIGSASVKEAASMHKMQRTTNTMASPSSFCPGVLTTKSLYVSGAQSASIAKSMVPEILRDQAPSLPPPGPATLRVPPTPMANASASASASSSNARGGDGQDGKQAE